MDKNIHSSAIAAAAASAVVARGAQISEELSKDGVHGVYHVDCVGPVETHRAEYVKLRDRIERMKRWLPFVWRLAAASSIALLAAIPMERKWDALAPAHNLVTTVGKNLLLDTFLAGSAYTTTGPYLGLIGAVSYTTGPAAGDTMASHGGWTESGGTNAPTYTAPRKTLAFSAASGGSKATSTAASYAITSGTNVVIKGCFLVLGSGAVSTIDSTVGTLYSAGAFTGGDKTVSNGDTLTVSYTASA